MSEEEADMSVIHADLLQLKAALESYLTAALRAAKKAAPDRFNRLAVVREALEAVKEWSDEELEDLLSQFNLVDENVHEDSFVLLTEFAQQVLEWGSGLASNVLFHKTNTGVKITEKVFDAFYESCFEDEEEGEEGEEGEEEYEEEKEPPPAPTKPQNPQKHPKPRAEVVRGGPGRVASSASAASSASSRARKGKEPEPKKTGGAGRGRAAEPPKPKKGVRIAEPEKEAPPKGKTAAPPEETPTTEDAPEEETE